MGAKSTPNFRLEFEVPFYICDVFPFRIFHDIELQIVFVEHNSVRSTQKVYMDFENATEHKT